MRLFDNIFGWTQKYLLEGHFYLIIWTKIFFGFKRSTTSQVIRHKGILLCVHIGQTHIMSVNINIGEMSKKIPNISHSAIKFAI